MSARTISIFVPPMSGRPIAIPMKRTAMHHAAIGRGGLMEAIHAWAPDLVAPANKMRLRFNTT